MAAQHLSVAHARSDAITTRADGLVGVRQCVLHCTGLVSEESESRLETTAKATNRAPEWQATSPAILNGPPLTDQESGPVEWMILRQLSRPDMQWWQRLGDVRQPTLILSGGPTSCIPPQRLADVTAAIPGARLTTIPVGHRVHSLARDRFSAEVLAFLAEPAFGSAYRTAETSPSSTV